MTIDEKRQRLRALCGSISCEKCSLCDVWEEDGGCYMYVSDDILNKHYDIVFGVNDVVKHCDNCLHKDRSEFDDLCIRCKNTDWDEDSGRPFLWEPKENNSEIPLTESDEKKLNGALQIINEVIPELTSNVPANDPVNRPAHYTDGNIEVIDFIEDKKLGFCLGNAVKYIARAGKKDPAKEVEDLEKARWYVDRRIKELTRG